MEVCPTCGGTGKCPTCRDSATINDDWNDEGDWDDDWRHEDYAQCGCRFCFCVVETLYGATCDCCLSGAHQG
jgi:hypothetical protein